VFFFSALHPCCSNSYLLLICAFELVLHLEQYCIEGATAAFPVQRRVPSVDQLCRPHVGSKENMTPTLTGLLCRYAHRAGRTARMGQAGEVYLMLMPHELEYINVLQKAGCNTDKCSITPLTKSLSSFGRVQVHTRTCLSSFLSLLPPPHTHTCKCRRGMHRGEVRVSIKTLLASTYLIS
jgi:hypothetical protein